MRVLIAGGGSGGHIFPGIALAETLGQRSGTVLHWIGSDRGLEQHLVPAHGISFEAIAVGRLKGSGVLQRAATVAGLPPAGLKALALLRRFKPDVVVGLGGYASAPVMAAARLFGKPVVLLEQNSIPGLTNRWLAKTATCVVTAYPDAARYLPEEKVRCLGNPLRHALIEQLKAAQPDAAADHLIILGGSQGARPLNQMIVEALPHLTLPMRVHHQTGSADVGWVKDCYKRHGIEAVVEPFIEDMAAAYRPATLAITRAGATTLAELAIAAIPAILVPYPHAADDHQSVNAFHYTQQGAAIAAPQHETDGRRLADLLTELLQNRQRLARMSQQMARCGYPNANNDVAELICTLAQGKDDA